MSENSLRDQVHHAHINIEKIEERYRMTIDERIKFEEKAIKDIQFKEEALDGLPGYMVTKEDYEECKKSANEHQELINWLKELQSHREAWDVIKEGLLEMSRLHEYVSIKHMIQLIDRIRSRG